MCELLTLNTVGDNLPAKSPMVLVHPQKLTMIIKRQKPRHTFQNNVFYFASVSAEQCFQHSFQYSLQISTRTEIFNMLFQHVCFQYSFQHALQISTH